MSHETTPAHMPEAGATQLVFIHGAGSNSDFWHEQRKAYPDAHFLDLPGHRASRREPAAQPGMTSIEAYADWVESYVRQAGISSAVLNGHSMGGAVTLTLALRKCGWLSAVVLTGTGARLRVMPRLLELLGSDYPAAVDLIVETSFAPPRGVLTYGEQARREGTRRQIMRTPREVTLGDYSACDRFSVLDRLAEIEVPALCLVGSDDLMTPPRYSEHMASHIRGAQYVVIEGAGHMLPLEKPDEYNDALVRFLSQLTVERG